MPIFGLVIHFLKIYLFHLLLCMTVLSVENWYKPAFHGWGKSVFGMDWAYPAACWSPELLLGFGVEVARSSEECLVFLPTIMPLICTVFNQTESATWFASKLYHCSNLLTSVHFIYRCPTEFRFDDLLIQANQTNIMLCQCYVQWSFTKPRPWFVAPMYSCCLRYLAQVLPCTIYAHDTAIPGRLSH